jgi:hypothetical protein
VLPCDDVCFGCGDDMLMVSVHVRVFLAWLSLICLRCKLPMMEECGEKMKKKPAKYLFCFDTVVF